MQRGIQVRKVSAKRHPVLPGIADISPRTECISNKGCQIYRITGKFTEPGEQSCRTYLTLSGAVSSAHVGHIDLAKFGWVGGWAGRREVGLHRQRAEGGGRRTVYSSRWLAENIEFREYA